MPHILMGSFSNNYLYAFSKVCLLIYCIRFISGKVRFFICDKSCKILFWWLWLGPYSLRLCWLFLLITLLCLLYFKYVCVEYQTRSDLVCRFQSVWMWLRNAIVRSSTVGCSCASQSGWKDGGRGSSSRLHTHLLCNSHATFIHWCLRE